jgi:nucleoside-diphosphate-sugar epimerase
VINLGSDEPIVLADAVKLVEELTGKQATIERKPRHPADVQATWADISKAEKLLGWRPQTNFRAGVGKLVDWYSKERSWASQIATGT